MELLKTIIGFILGGSKWPLIIVSLLFITVGGYIFYTINDLQSRLRTEELNNEIMKSNVEKLEEAKKIQDKTIEDYKNIVNLSVIAYTNTIELMKKQVAQNQILIKKLDKIDIKKIKENPEQFEKKVNESMTIINACYEALSKVDLKGPKNEIPECDLNLLPDFSK